MAISKARSQLPKKKFYFKKDISKLFFSNYVWTWSSMIEVHRQPFQRPGHNHPKRNFISKKKIFQKKISNYICTDPLWENYVGSLFKGPITITQKETSFQKRNFFLKKILFSKLFFRTIFGPDPLWERYIGNFFKGLVTITQKETSFQKRRFFKLVRTTFGPNPLWERYIGSLSKDLVTITQKTFFQRLEIKTFLCVNLG